MRRKCRVTTRRLGHLGIVRAHREVIVFFDSAHGCYHGGLRRGSRPGNLRRSSRTAAWGLLNCYCFWIWRSRLRAITGPRRFIWLPNLHVVGSSAPRALVGCADRRLCHWGPHRRAAWPAPHSAVLLSSHLRL